MGDQVEQQVAMEMRLSTAHRQGTSLMDQSTLTARNEQRRAVTTVAVEDGRSTAVLVRYLSATKQLDKHAGDGTDDSSSQPLSQPVEGRVYRCRREPGKDGKLIVTDEAGNIPPLNEYEIVVRHMEAVGRANPLADFLAGRTLRVGETVSLPKDLSEQLFGLGAEFGEITRFDLSLNGTETIDGVQCALFEAHVEVTSRNSSQMRLHVEGPLVVQVDACRALRMHLAGPLAMSESRGSHSNAYYLITTGRLAMSIESAYRDAER